MKIRLANEGDGEALRNIYSPYVTDTTISFEYDVPTIEAFKERITSTLKDYPFFVAENRQGEILGYAYAHTYNNRSGYAWTAEVTIYLAASAKGKGVGKQLYEQLESTLARQQVIHLVACITGNNKSSQRFHERLGYQEIGKFQNFAKKFDKWYDIVWMQKTLKEPMEVQTNMIPFSAL